MERYQFRPTIDNRLASITQVPDNGILAVNHLLREAMRFYGTHASSPRNQLVFDSTLDIFCTVAHVFYSRYNVGLVEFLNAIHAELEREPRPTNRTREDWLLMMNAHMQRAMGRRVYECTQELGMHSLYGCDRSSGCMFQLAVIAYASLEDTPYGS